MSSRTDIGYGQHTVSLVGTLIPEPNVSGARIIKKPVLRESEPFAKQALIVLLLPLALVGYLIEHDAGPERVRSYSQLSDFETMRERAKDFFARLILIAATGALFALLTWFFGGCIQMYHSVNP